VTVPSLHFEGANQIAPGWLFFFLARDKEGVEVKLDRENGCVQVYYQRGVSTPDDIFKALNGLELNDTDTLHVEVSH
jgi:hypothetical protein